MDIVSGILTALKLLRIAVEWLQKRGYINEGRAQQIGIEAAELARTMGVTHEEDTRARGDTDDALVDELKSPIDTD